MSCACVHWKEGLKMGIIAWIIFGLIAGVIAKLIMPGRDGGGFILTPRGPFLCIAKSELILNPRPVITAFFNKSFTINVLRIEQVIDRRVNAESVTDGVVSA